MTDWEGQGGLGSHHLLAYNIKPTVTGFAEGELGKESDKFTGGKETGGTTVYRGPCPPASTVPTIISSLSSRPTSNRARCRRG